MDSTTNTHAFGVSTAQPLLTEDELFSLRRVILVSNGKGGVGKTSVTTNTSSLLAAAGYKVLVVDLDSQGNVAMNLGFDETDADDQGKALNQAVTFDTAPEPSKDVRPGLDVLAGGRFTSQIIDVIYGDTLRGGRMRGCIARALAKIADNYDFIFIDTPPSEAGVVVIDEAMLAARWIIAPLRPEPKSIKGLYSLANRIQPVQGANPYIQLLGVVMFGIPTNATKVEQRAREILEDKLKEIAPTFKTRIREVVAADSDASFRGQAVHELAADVKSQSPFWERLKAGAAASPALASSASSLSEDYLSLAKEIVDELEAQEAAYESETGENQP